MHKIFKLAILVGIVGALSACEDQYNYQYLITHPTVMKKKMDACATMSKTASNLEKQRCEIVVNASTKFMAIVAEQQIDAEKFGVRVLATETEYANAKIKVKKIEGDLATAKSGAADAATVHKLEEDLVLARKECLAKRDEVKLLLAVVGVMSPN